MSNSVKNRKTTSFTMPVEDHAQFKALCVILGKTPSAVVRDLINNLVVATQASELVIKEELENV